ncbi:MAG: HU family DNA-binding protein [Pseudorhodobacter sp.]
MTKAPKAAAKTAAAASARKSPATAKLAPGAVADLTPAPVVVPKITLLPVGDAVADDSDKAASAAGGGLKKQELLARVAALSGAKRKDAKPILEAALRVLGDALSKGEDLNLPPLGKVKVNRSKAGGGTEILTLRLRRPEGDETRQKPCKEGLAPDGEDD